MLKINEKKNKQCDIIKGKSDQVNESLGKGN